MRASHRMNLVTDQRNVTYIDRCDFIRKENALFSRDRDTRRALRIYNRLEIALNHGEIDGEDV